jgi:hypothetical protein
MLTVFFSELSAVLGHPVSGNRRTWSAGQRIELEKRIALEASREARPLVIHLDEIPTDSASEHVGFVKAFVAFLIHFANKYPPPHPKYFVSSILSPSDHLAPTQRKVSERLRFVSTALWSVDDVMRLKDLICNTLRLTIAEHDTQSILRAAHGSPRILKDIMRRLVTNLDRDDRAVDRAVAETVMNGGGL